MAFRCELAERLAEALKPKAKENQKAGLETSSKRGGKVHPILGEPIECLKQAANEAGQRGADKSANIGEVVDAREALLAKIADLKATRPTGWQTRARAICSRLADLAGLDDGKPEADHPDREEVAT